MIESKLNAKNCNRGYTYFGLVRSRQQGVAAKNIQQPDKRVNCLLNEHGDDLG